MTASINGVPTRQWGTWCQHGKRIIEPDPTQPLDHTNPGRVVEPWPCIADGCTLASFEQDMADEEADYWAFLWDEHIRLITS